MKEYGLAGIGGSSGGFSCSGRQEDIVLYLYQELPASGARELEDHLEQCGPCREELSTFRQTFGSIDGAQLSEWATCLRPGDWSEIEVSLLAERAAPGRSDSRLLPTLAKAAAVLLVAGASFLAGRQWETLESLLATPLGEPPPPWAASSPPGRGLGSGDGPHAPDTASRLRAFSEQTNGYLDRSRLVLLEFANAEPAAAPPALREASRSLLRENRMARKVAGQMADERLEGLLTELENVLREIARLSDQGDPGTIDRVRARLNESGLLEKLEILSVLPGRVAQNRSRA